MAKWGLETIEITALKTLSGLRYAVAIFFSGNISLQKPSQLNPGDLYGRSMYGPVSGQS